MSEDRRDDDRTRLDEDPTRAVGPDAGDAG